MEPALLWTPVAEVTDNSNLKKYMIWLASKNGKNFSGYSELWQWSTENPSDFWQSIWTYFDIQHNGTFTKPMSSDPMPHTRWFEGTSLNYAEHVFRRANENHPAIIAGNERNELTLLSWSALKQKVSAIQQVLREHGVCAGDTVVAYMPGIAEATIAFLAVNALGAIWSSCSPDFGTRAVLDRFTQIEPKALIAVDEYQYNGKVHDKSSAVEELVSSLPLSFTLLISNKTQESKEEKFIYWNDVIDKTSGDLSFTRVPFSHPIWILYSSGTTGLPKAITHSHGGILLEQLKYGTFHNDFKEGERCFWYTTTGWMMWNYIHASLLCGGVMVLYDGSPAFPDLSVLWRFAEEAGIVHFGTSAGFILANMKENISPKKIATLKELRSIGSTGSTLPPEGFDWIYNEVKNDLWLASMSGGTDICSAFVGGNPTWPVYAGEIQCRALGCKLEAWDEHGHPVVNEEGEMVITRPMPSMPVFFWNDKDFVRYRESYFDMYPSVWRHGDWIKVTNREGIVIFGRSDATLNRGGIRIGTSEIYRAVDHVPEVKDSLIVCIEKPGGEFWMPLFVVMKAGHEFTDDVRKTINHAIRQANSPRHVPDDIIPVADIPYTISGKKTEMPVKKILMGKDPEKVVNPGSLRNPESVKIFTQWKI
jgi:acetoacetyl-CoA synthetase